MGKLPAFQFYPGDWLKDPQLRRCSPAARGVWMDMLCLMFECENRGVLSAGGSPWSDQEIAAAVSGDTVQVLSCVRELLAKGVAHRDANGAIFSRRLVRDQQSRTQIAVRVRKHRGSVTPSVTQAVTQIKRPCTEDEVEVETEVEVALGLEEFDHEKAVREIQSAHPRPEDCQRNEIAILEAIEYVVKDRKCSRREAAEWLLAKAEMYRLKSAESEKQFITKSTRWFAERQFKEDPSFWGGSKRNGKHQQQQEPAHNGDPNCSRCQGSGLRGSYSAPGRSVECECVSALLEGDGAGSTRGPHLLETKGPA